MKTSLLWANLQFSDKVHLISLRWYRVYGFIELDF